MLFIFRGVNKFEFNIENTTNMRLKFLIAFLVILYFGACKKYEEDGYLFTLRTPLKRIAGKHEITEFTFNGADSTSYLKSRLGNCYLLFLDNLTDQGDYYLNVYKKEDNKLIASGSWGFLTKEEQIAFEFIGDSNRVFSSGNLAIKKLTYEEIILEASNAYLNSLDTSLVQTPGDVRFKLVRF